jgi:hypothetical protein
MLARLDEPLRLLRSQDSKSAIGRKTIVAIAPDDEPWFCASTCGDEAVPVETIGVSC